MAAGGQRARKRGSAAGGLLTLRVVHLLPELDGALEADLDDLLLDLAQPPGGFAAGLRLQAEEELFDLGRAGRHEAPGRAVEERPEVVEDALRGERQAGVLHAPRRAVSRTR